MESALAHTHTPLITVFPFDDEYLKFQEEKKKECDIMYKFFDGTEIEFKRHYLKSIVEDLLKPMYMDRSDNTQQYVFTQHHWEILKKIISSDDNNVLDMFWFFCLFKLRTIVDWLIKGDEKNGFVSRVHNPEKFQIFLQRDLNQICKDFLESNSKNTNVAAVRKLRAEYFRTCGIPCQPERWRLEWKERKRKIID